MEERKLTFGVKRGRPRKAKPPEQAPLATPAVTPSAPPPLTPSQQAEIDKIMAEAKVKAEQVILGGSPNASLGTPSGNIEDKTAEIQRDFLPGKFRKDKTYIPERVYDEKLQVTRKVLRSPDEVRYVLCPAEDFLTYTSLGYKFVKYDGGNMSGLEGLGFQNTGDAIFTRELNGNCRRGDAFYMWIPTRGWEALAKEDREKAEGTHARAVGVFHNAAYNVGIKPFAEMKDQDNQSHDLFK